MRSLISPKIQYINELYGKETQILRSIKASAPKEKAHMQISPYEGAILKFFVQLINARSVVEIGTFVGYSTAYMAEGLEEGGKIFSIEKNTHYFEIARNNVIKYGLNKKIEVFNEDGNTFLKAMKQKVDLIFIDGKKIEYCNYLSGSINIIRSGGIIIADNTLLFDNICKDTLQSEQEILMQQEMRKFNQEIANDKVFQAIMLPTDSGLTVALKK